MARVLGPDGLTLEIAEDQRLNALILTTFGRGAGREVLAWLRSISIEMVGGPQITDGELRHREGMRYLVAVIEGRMKQGEPNGIRTRTTGRGSRRKPTGSPDTA
jgi:hypothetical protein